MLLRFPTCKKRFGSTYQIEKAIRDGSQELVETDDAAAGTHTFALRFKKRGLVFSVR